MQVNDIHSRLNPTRVAAIEYPDSADAIRAAIRRAQQIEAGISICGSRHAMGGQQFGRDTVLLDLSRHARIRSLDVERGLVTADTGIRWPELIDGLWTQQRDAAHVWSIRQKQTGANDLSLGGALAANVHGRGLTLPPIIADVESFVLVDANGETRVCSREQNVALFRLAIGGYGLFGVIASVTLRLSPRQKLARRVEIVSAAQLMFAFDERIASGFLFGDFQFAIDETSPDFLQRGLLSCYRPVENDRPISENQRRLGVEDWQRLLFLAHTDRARAFAEYERHYLATDGQIYWSDTHQLNSVYLENYHTDLDRRLGSAHAGSEMITELYVPRDALAAFLPAAAELLRAQQATVIYGTVRLIEMDRESFLAWARESFACIIFNLHATHMPPALAKLAETFRALIALATNFGGSFYLTYHRYADRAQVEACYPQFRDFLRLQREHDPAGRWQSDWLRHYQNPRAAAAS